MHASTSSSSVNCRNSRPSILSGNDPPKYVPTGVHPASTAARPASLSSCSHADRRVPAVDILYACPLEVVATPAHTPPGSAGPAQHRTPTSRPRSPNPGSPRAEPPRSAQTARTPRPVPQPTQLLERVPHLPPHVGPQHRPQNVLCEVHPPRPSLVASLRRDEHRRPTTSIRARCATIAEINAVFPARRWIVPRQSSYAHSPGRRSPSCLRLDLQDHINDQLLVRHQRPTHRHRHSPHRRPVRRPLSRARRGPPGEDHP